MIQMPRSLSSFKVRARLVTIKYGTVSAAPLATLATVALIPAAWSLGAITAWAPAPSATRRQAPRLCGSVTPSSTKISGGVRCSGGKAALAASRFFQQFVQRMLLRQGLHRAATPWWPWLPHSLARRSLSDSISRTPPSLARCKKLAHAGIAPVGLEMDFDNGGRRGLETHAQGMKAE
jgi:hypothetical protein